jgi:hypothetical protein
MIRPVADGQRVEHIREKRIECVLHCSRRPRQAEYERLAASADAEAAQHRVRQALLAVSVQKRLDASQIG